MKRTEKSGEIVIKSKKCPSCYAMISLPSPTPRREVIVTCQYCGFEARVGSPAAPVAASTPFPEVIVSAYKLYAFIVIIFTVAGFFLCLVVSGIIMLLQGPRSESPPPQPEQMNFRELPAKCPRYGQVIIENTTLKVPAKAIVTSGRCKVIIKNSTIESGDDFIWSDQTGEIKVIAINSNLSSQGYFFYAPESDGTFTLDNSTITTKKTGLYSRRLKLMAKNSRILSGKTGVRTQLGGSKIIFDGGGIKAGEYGLHVGMGSDLRFEGATIESHGKAIWADSVLKLETNGGIIKSDAATAVHAGREAKIATKGGQIIGKQSFVVDQRSEIIVDGTEVTGSYKVFYGSAQIYGLPQPSAPELF